MQEFTSPDKLIHIQDAKVKETILKTQCQVKHAVQENRILKEQVRNLNEENQNYEQQQQQLTNTLHTVGAKMKTLVNSMTAENDDLKKEFSDLTGLYEKTKDELDNVNFELAKANENLSSSSTRNLNKKIRQRDEKNSKISKDKSSLETSLKDSQCMLESSEEIVDQLKEKNKTLSAERLSAQKQISYFKTKKIESLLRKNEDNENKISQLEKDINSYTKLIDELSSTNELLQSNILNTFSEGRYVNEIRLTVMSLLTECNVSLSKVNKEISTVLKNLTGKLPARLPSAAVLSRLYVEARAVAHAQIAEAMLEGAKIEDLVGNCLHGDATS